MPTPALRRLSVTKKQRRPQPHDRAARRGRPEPPPRTPDEALEQLAPYAGSGGHTPYVFPGQQIQTANFVDGLVHNRHWANRAIGWVLIVGIVAAAVGFGVWRLLSVL